MYDFHDRHRSHGLRLVAERYIHRVKKYELNEAAHSGEHAGAHVGPADHSAEGRGAHSRRDRKRRGVALDRHRCLTIPCQYKACMRR
jgi:hypothetical protein